MTYFVSSGTQYHNAINMFSVRLLYRVRKNRPSATVSQNESDILQGSVAAL